MAQIVEQTQAHFYTHDQISRPFDVGELVGSGVGLVDQYDDFCKFVFKGFYQRESYVARNVSRLFVNALLQIVSRLVYRKIVVICHGQGVD